MISKDLTPYETSLKVKSPVVIDIPSPVLSPVLVHSLPLLTLFPL